MSGDDLPPRAAPAGDEPVLLARQPILDAASAVHGHELLFRRPDGSGWPIDDEAQATAQVVLAAFADLSLSAVAGSARAWVNVPRSFLLGVDLCVLPADRVVLELLERDEVDDLYVRRVAALVADGYRVALDDFTWRPEVLPLLEHATYVKLDLRELGVAGMAECVELLAPYDVTLVAEKVETADERDACLALGIGLFQGYFFERPRLVRGRPAPPSALARLRTATGLPVDAPFEQVEELVLLDPGLVVRLLRYINSAALGLRHPVASVRQALMLVGTRTVRQWILLLHLGALGAAQPAVLGAALVRARLCATLVRDRGPAAADSAFVTGLLSVCDALLERPLDEVVGDLPLASEVRDALLDRRGPLGEVLRTAVDLERGAFPPHAPEAGLLLDAVRWADAQLGELPLMAAAA